MSKVAFRFLHPVKDVKRHNNQIEHFFQSNATGLEMLVNMKPVVEDQITKYTPYTLGISTKTNLIDQKRGIIDLKPGYRISLKVIPHVFDYSSLFKQMDRNVRKCAFTEEIEGFKLLNNYTRVGCEFECAFKEALKVCQCIPWNFLNDYKEYPMCDMFSSKCFDLILSDETHYKQCPEECLEDCSATMYTVFPTFVPINVEEVCQATPFKGIFKKLLGKYDYYHHYEMIMNNQLELIENGTNVKGHGQMMNSTEFCHDYVKKYVAYVDVEGSVNSVMKSQRQKRVTFTDQLSMIGGTLGLFSGISILSLCEVAIFILTTIGQKIKKLFVRNVK